MGSGCDKQTGATKLQKLNIRTYNPKVKQGIPHGQNEIPLWETHYDKYTMKQLARECKRLDTEIKGALERLKKIEESLNIKKDKHSETVQQIEESEAQYSKINERSKQLLTELRRQRTLLIEQHSHEQKTGTDKKPKKLDSRTQEWFAKVTKQEYIAAPKHQKAKQNIVII